jgi:hypothetical protein
MPYRRGFSFDGLTKARGECNSKMVFTVLDCCYSGADKLGKGSAKGLDKAQEESASVAKDTIKEKSILPGEGKCVLAACKPMQKAFEYKEKGHSFFSYYLSVALTSQECVDKDGDVTPYAVNTYIDNKIRSLSPDIRPKQTPFLNCSTAGKIVLAHYPKEVSPSASEWKGSKSEYLLKLLQEEKIEEFLDLSGADLRSANLYANSPNPGVTFSIPLNEGNTIRVCVADEIVGTIFGSGNCQDYSITGQDMQVTQDAG